MKSGADAGCACACACGSTLLRNDCWRDEAEPRSEAAGDESQNEGARIESEAEDGVGDVARFSTRAGFQRARLLKDPSCAALKMSRERDAPPDENGEAPPRNGLESTTCKEEGRAVSQGFPKGR